MSKGLALLLVFIAAFVFLVGILGLFAGIATTFATTEESFFKIGATPKLHGAALAIFGAVIAAAGYFLTRLAAKISD